MINKSLDPFAEVVNESNRSPVVAVLLVLSWFGHWDYNTVSPLWNYCALGVNHVNNLDCFGSVIGVFRCILVEFVGDLVVGSRRVSFALLKGGIPFFVGIRRVQMVSHWLLVVEGGSPLTLSYYQPLARHLGLPRADSMTPVWCQ